MLVGIDRDLGRINLPFLDRLISYPGKPARRAINGEFAIFVTKQKRPKILDWQRYIDPLGIEHQIPIIAGYETIWCDITHNERVDAGASYQAKQCFAAGSSPGAPSATVYFNVLAIANGTLTKAKTDQSLGAASASVTTNEYTTIGLSRATANTPVGGDYTAPSTLGGTFSQVISKTMTVSGAGGTAYGAGIFNSTTVSGSILYAEDNYSSTAVLVAADTLTTNATIAN